jgi:hypothetical protein
VIVEDQMRLQETILQLFPILFCGGLQSLEEGSIGVIDHCELTVNAYVLPVLEEAVLDTGMVSV